MNTKNILRDISFLFFVSFWSGFVYGFANRILGFEISNTVFLSVNFSAVFVGFCIVAYWTRINRLSHLMNVGRGLWLLSLTNLIYIEPWIWTPLWIGAVKEIMILTSFVIFAVLTSNMIVNKFLKKNEENKSSTGNSRSACSQIKESKKVDIIRDISFLYFLIYWSGFVYGFAQQIFGFEISKIVVAAVNYPTVFIGFCIVAYWTGINRLKHLMVVGVGLWLFSLVNLAYSETKGELLINISLMSSCIALSVLLSWLIAEKSIRSAE